MLLILLLVAILLFSWKYFDYIIISVSSIWLGSSANVIVTWAVQKDGSSFSIRRS